MFALGLDAYVVAGLLAGIGHEFGSSTARTGQTVTAFTLCYAIAAPLLTTAFGGESVRTMLIAALSIFSLANAASTLAANLAALFAARSVAGMGAGLFSSVAVAAAAAIMPSIRKGRAVGVMLGSLSAGTAIGVPLGLLVNGSIGWRATLWLVTGIGVSGLLSVVFGFRAISVASQPSQAKRLPMLAQGKIASTVGVTFLMAIGSLGLYTYISPIVLSIFDSHVVTPYLWFWGGGRRIGQFHDRLGHRPTGRGQCVDQLHPLGADTGPVERARRGYGRSARLHFLRCIGCHGMVVPRVAAA
ncbi:MFS transporter [Paraburkholderia nemoris]|uniref:MFS transporter n=1 Tax=Paraburkholderia nemoris TaxID=2793076 RepID=UPI001B8BD2B0|nr:MFS transporter [Paraburkholderia nemoris]